MDITKIDLTNFTHCTENEYIETEYEQNNESWDIKPKAIWLAPNNDWIEWCTSSGIWPHYYHYQYIIDTIEIDRILLIDSMRDIKLFIKNYGIVFTGSEECKFYRIDWEKVAQDYAGIYINRNNLYCKINMSLIYSLDVISLAIWDPTVVKFKLLRHNPNGFDDSDELSSESV